MLGKFSEQVEINASASAVWNLYSTLQFAKFVVEKLPHIVEKVELIEGNGGSGSVMLVSLPGNASYKEKFVSIDDEKRVKEVEIVEGGYLDLGFSFYGIKFEVIEKDENLSIVKMTIDFETKDAENIPLTIGNFQALVAIMKATVEYFNQKSK
ncbi:PREDICTED: S-norcoclaurine synthase 1-like [Nicotiana attenuata]|uniref:Phytohormone-binding protein n=1 Tax=Nicotiana attenuata TaxID=49451 RepID=A0A314KQ67_NICAT|nr:PREDICTED: S-norcoclaurine synthase 1-like [Nicotiana attenuata]OIT31470.1 phytohormone-binding protein [Nicotiana attenuata]